VYTSTETVEARFGTRFLVQMTREGAETTVDTDLLASVIAEVEAEIDGYVGRAYALPLAIVPTLLMRLAADMVRFRLYARKPNLRIPEDVTKRFDADVKVLERIAKRDISLGLPLEPSQESGQGAVLSSGKRTFTRGSMRGF